MFPIWMFEKQLVDLGICGWCEAPYFSRMLIALEMAIGVAILQKHFLRRFVIPVTAFLLVAFCIHLSIEMVKHGAMNGNVHSNMHGNAHGNKHNSGNMHGNINGNPPGYNNMH